MARGDGNGGKLTEKLKHFCREYAKDFNGSRAARAVGASEKTAKVQASRWLTFDNVQAELQRIQAARAKKLDVSAERVLNELARIGFARIDHVLSFDENGVHLKDSAELDEDALAAVAEVTHQVIRETDQEGKTVDRGTVRLKLHDKKGSLELLGRHLALFKDKIEVSTDEKLQGALGKLAGVVKQRVR